ncbi:MAG TPA: hypothetical protein VGS15_03555 [Candidatus Acidoferrales bacterium]|nr:hypothetical protein [Candidatus Acidoferrales bacterium]
MKISAKQLLGIESRPAESFAALMACLILFASVAFAQAGDKLQRPAAKPQSVAKLPAPSSRVTSIDSSTGVVTAVVNSTGQTFQFRVTDPAQLKSLAVGQGVFANLKTSQVSFDGKTPAGTIIALGPVDGAKPLGPVDGAKPLGPVDVAKPAGPVDGARPLGSVDVAKPAGPVDGAKPLGPVDGLKTPAAQIAQIDSATGIVTARETSTGRTIQFRLADSSALKTVAPGQGVYVNYKAGQISLDGKTPAGTIIGLGPVDGAKPLGPVDGAKPLGRVDVAKPAGPVDGAKPLGPVDGLKTPAAPAAEVVRVDSATGVAIGREKATGRQFMFHIVDPSAAKSLAPGKGVYVNYKAGQVSLDGKTPAGPILMIGPAMNAPGATQTTGSAQNAGGLMPNGQAATATLQSDTLACSTKRGHMGKPVAQNVMVPSGAPIYCRFQLPSRGLMPPDRQVALSYNPPGAVWYPPRTAQLTSPSGSLQGPNQGPYADFQINSRAIPQTVPLTISASFSSQSASTTVTLARAAISIFECDPSYLTHTTACDVPVLAGQIGGGYGSPISLYLTAPADPDGMSLSLTTSYGYSGQVSVTGGSSGAEVSFPGQAVGKETPFSVAIVDPLDGSIHTISGLLEPPVVTEIWFGTSGVASLSGVPLDGEQVQVNLSLFGDPPADGSPLQIQYGGTPNLISGPATVPFPQSNYYGQMTFPVTVLPCGVPPCQVTVTAGNSALSSKTATLTVIP